MLGGSEVGGVAGDSRGTGSTFGPAGAEYDTGDVVTSSQIMGFGPRVLMTRFDAFFSAAQEAEANTSGLCFVLFRPPPEAREAKLDPDDVVWVKLPIDDIDEDGVGIMKSEEGRVEPPDSLSVGTSEVDQVRWSP